jgi:hypothetical protein
MSPVDIRGKSYFTVAERLVEAAGDQEPPKGIREIITFASQVGSMVIVTAKVIFTDGRTFTGMSLAKNHATSPAERDAPLETAETSAVGRALAFAGYHGSPEGIAGAEEIELARQRAEERTQVPAYPDGSSPVTRMPQGGSGAAPRPIGNPSGPTPAQVRFASKLWGEAGRPMPPPDFEAMNRADVSRLIDELNAVVRR